MVRRKEPHVADFSKISYLWVRRVMLNCATGKEQAVAEADIPVRGAEGVHDRNSCVRPTI